MKSKLFLFLSVLAYHAGAQIVYRPQPAEWKNLVEGAQFIDRFLPMSGSRLAHDVWGADAVLPRYVDNGIEDDSISYWGGNIIKEDDGLYHFFVCGWREDNPEGHFGYNKYSEMYHAVCDNPIGPFRQIANLGDGHNTEIIPLSDGRYMLYYVLPEGGHEEHCRYLISHNLNGPWKPERLPLDLRNRPVRLGGGIWTHNMSFCKREDGSILMLSRCGSIWVSQTGTSTYKLVTGKSIYPMVDGKYEDPVIWKDYIQYHAIVNDWLGRTAFYLRSKDGVNWVTDPGQAYAPGIAKHANGHTEGWYKFERIRMRQDEYGRAIQANFAVCDTLKHFDLTKDKYSAKNIAIPLNPGLLIAIENQKPFDYKTKEISVRIRAEKGFNPQSEVDVASLRFGASSEVNYGRGAVALRSQPDGDDLIVVFEAKNHCISEEEFAPKLLGKNKSGNMLFGYARLPWQTYVEPILSANKPSIKKNKLVVEVENFGQVASGKALLSVSGYDAEGKLHELALLEIPPIQPYKSIKLNHPLPPSLKTKGEVPVVLKIVATQGHPEVFFTSLSNEYQLTKLNTK